MSPSTRITVYADDNTPLVGGTYTGGDNALDIIHKVGDHFRPKKFFFNADKSSEMLLNFGRHDVPLIFGIDRKSSVKLLGISFDEKLSFNDHVKCITKRANAKLYVVFRVRRIGFVNKHFFLRLWYYPHLRIAFQFGAEHLMRNSERLTEFSLKQFVLGSSTSTLL